MIFFTSFRILARCLFALLFFPILSVSNDEPAPNVITFALEAGTLQGSILKSAKGRDFLAFRGIPYAKPPIDSLRFMPPQPIEQWNLPRNVTDEGSVCPHINILTGEYVGSEDCLFLNVYTPKIYKKENGNILPVMVWIHGGLFISGSGNSDLHGPEMFLDEDVVLVTINYRLGVLGFLSTGDQSSVGNYGLKDQVMALKWVKDNIHNFGGDSKRVTIFGTDAGAASVHFHILSPMSKGLFHRAISQSGSALNRWAFTENGAKETKRLAELVGCDIGDNSQIVDCLKGHPAERLVRTTLSLKEWGTDLWNPFVPVAERKGYEAFLPSSPKKIMLMGKVNKVKYMLGVNSHEGILPAKLLLQDPVLSYEMKTELHHYLPKYLGYDEYSDDTTKIIKMIAEFYFGNETLSTSLYNKFYEMEMDYRFLHGVYKTAKLLSRGMFPKIYFYNFSYDGNLQFPSSSLKDGVKGVNHGEELVYMFKSKSFPMNYEPQSLQEITSKRILKMWTNFATEGNPIPETTGILNVTWEPYSSQNEPYLDIGDNLKMKKGLHNDRMSFWDMIDKKFQTKDRKKDEL